MSQPDVMRPVLARLRPPVGRTTLAGPRDLPRTVAVNLLLLAFAAVIVFPLYWVLMTSFLPKQQILTKPQALFVTTPQLDNYIELFTVTNFGRSLINSAIVAVAVMAIGAYFAALAGYAFAKHQFRGRNALFVTLLATMMVPATVTVIPNFLLMSQLGLIDSLWAVILPQLTPAFGIFWMRQYIGSAVPSELLDAARIDGASEFGIFNRIVLPVIRPGVAGLAVWLFMMSWNALLLPLAYLHDPNTVTYPVFLAGLKGLESVVLPPTNLLVAAAVVSTLPIITLFVFAQRSFIAGLTAGAGR